LSAGEAFSDLAREFSQDTGSAADGGDLGYFQKGVMDPAFEDAVYSMLNIGDVSEPVKTEYGFHLIQLTDIKSPQGQSFSEAKEEVEQKYRLQQAETVFYEKAEQLADLSYENPDNLDIPAEELGLTIKHSDEFTRNGGSGIATDKNLVNVAFSEDVVVNNLNSAVIELSKTHLVVLHKNKHSSASELPFESIAPAIAEQLKFEKASDLAKQIGLEKLNKLQAGESPETVFENGNWIDTQSYTRMSSEISAQILDYAFKTPYPTEEQAQYSSFNATNGNFIVIKVSDVQAGDASIANQQDREALTAYLMRTQSTSEVQAFIDSLKANAEIEIFQNNLK
jgi:peptidyl-prolyl cis-trans isomerase D